MSQENRKFMTGSEVCIQAARDAGASMMYGYPITPTTEVFTGWIKRGYPHLQTEDEIAAGFAVAGAVLAGQKAFTATSGPGHILMQDSFSMAEAMRLPFVMVVGQRGGPSSGTVIYSQQEVMLACFGGNGEGHRLVYAPIDSTELYKLTRQAFNDAWKYRFPAVVLTDGYLLKTKGVVNLESDLENIEAHPLVGGDRIVHWQNIFSMEEELNAQIMEHDKDFWAVAEEIAIAEEYKCADADIIIFAHGIVAASAKEAVDELRKQNIKAGLFRPITLRPFSKKQLDKLTAVKCLKRMVVVESSLGQLARLIKDNLAPEVCGEFTYLQKPALGIEMEEIVDSIENLKLN